MQKQFQAPPSRSPHPEPIQGPPWGWPAEVRSLGSRASRRGRPSPAQHLDLQILPRSKIMARRWLRSPRIRNTFMVQPAGPEPTRRQLRGTSCGRGGCHVPGPGPRAPLPAPPSSAPRPGAAAPPARSWPGGDVARPAAAGGARKRPARDPASRPVPATRSRGGAAGPGRGASGPLPAAQATLGLRGPAPARPAPRGARGSPGLCCAPRHPRSSRARPWQAAGPSLPQFPLLYTGLITPVPG